MQVTTTGYMPEFLGPTFSGLDESLQEDFKRVVSYISYKYARFHGTKDAKLQLPAKALWAQSRNYRQIIEILKAAGFFNYVCPSYTPPKNGQKGACRWFLMGNKFLQAVRQKTWIKFERSITLRQSKTASIEAREHQIKDDQEYMDDFCAHVQKSLNEFEIDHADLEGYVPAKKGKAVDPLKSKECVARSILDLKAKKGTVKRSTKVNKIINPLQSIPRQFRKGLLRGEATVELDLKSSHIWILKDYVAKDTNEKAKLQTLLDTGDFWTALLNESGLGLSRDEFKQLFFKCLSTRRNRKDKKIIALRNYLESHFRNLVFAVMAIEKVEPIQCHLQRIEAQIIDGYIYVCMTKDIPVIPIFDSFILRKSDAAFAFSYFGENNIK